jgi:chorismate mutase
VCGDRAGAMTVRAARGAITVDQDSREAVLAATERLLGEILQRNGLHAADVISIVFTATDDIRSAFPAQAARRMGLRSVPLLCARELAVDGAIPGCIRVLVHFHTDRAPEEVGHVYLEGARSLRDDLG